MITLYGYKPAFGLPDPSPFVSKVEVLLKMASLPYERKTAMPNKGPKGKIPWIVDNGVALGDSTLIRWHIEQKYGVDFDAGYTPAERAQAWAFEKMLEDHLYWALASSRWNVAANFDKGPRTFFDSVPAPLRPFIIAMVKRNFRKTLNAQGTRRPTSTGWPLRTLPRYPTSWPTSHSCWESGPAARMRQYSASFLARYARCLIRARMTLRHPARTWWATPRGAPVASIQMGF